MVMTSACLVARDDSSGATCLRRRHRCAAAPQAAPCLAPATATKVWHVVEPSGGRLMVQQPSSGMDG